MHGIQMSAFSPVLTWFDDQIRSTAQSRLLFDEQL